MVTEEPGMKPDRRAKPLQFCFYWGAWWRLFLEKPFMPGIYRWRLAIGPLDIRRWERGQR